jgi:hypothetical protein
VAEPTGTVPEDLASNASVQETEGRIAALREVEAAVRAAAAEIARFHKSDKGLLYADPSEGLLAVRKDFYYWSTKLTESSFALSLAVIAANWAVFGSLTEIVRNRWSQLSIAVVILALGMNLIGYKRLIDLLRKQIRYANADRKRWDAEFARSLLDGKCDWPYTRSILDTARFFRFWRTWLPLVGGALFLVALFMSNVSPRK